MFVLKFVVVFKELHRADIVRECTKRLGQFKENFQNTREINPPLLSGPCDYIYE